MDESIAWLQQAIADRKAVELFAANAEGWTRCHVLAKCQQTVEKAIKAIIAALRHAGILHIEIGYRHEVERFLTVLIRTRRTAGPFNDTCNRSSIRTRATGFAPWMLSRPGRPYPENNRAGTPNTHFTMPAGTGRIPRPRSFSPRRRWNAFGSSRIVSWTTRDGSSPQFGVLRGERKTASD